MLTGGCTARYTAAPALALGAADPLADDKLSRLDTAICERFIVDVTLLRYLLLVQG
jgi:hypothetical protein